LSARSSNSTVPALPSTRTRSPVHSTRLPLRVFTTHGMPSSLATTAAWLSAPPMSTTSAEERNMIDAQLGSVVGVTRTSPSSTSAKLGSATTRTTPSAMPALTPMPLTALSAGSPAATGAGTPRHMLGMVSDWYSRRRSRRRATSSPAPGGSSPVSSAAVR